MTDAVGALVLGNNYKADPGAVPAQRRARERIAEYKRLMGDLEGAWQARSRPGFLPSDEELAERISAARG